LRGRDRIKGNVRYGEKRETNRSMTEREREGWGSLERKKEGEHGRERECGMR
jgi:hypothetical protein